MEIVCAACGEPMERIVAFDKTCSPECGAEIIRRLSEIHPKPKKIEGISLEQFNENLADITMAMDAAPELKERILNPLWLNEGVWKRGATSIK